MVARYWVQLFRIVNENRIIITDGALNNAVSLNDKCSKTL